MRQYNCTFGYSFTFNSVGQTLSIQSMSLKDLVNGQSNNQRHKVVIHLPNNLWPPNRFSKFGATDFQTDDISYPVSILIMEILCPSIHRPSWLLGLRSNVNDIYMVVSTCVFEGLGLSTFLKNLGNFGVCQFDLPIRSAISRTVMSELGIVISRSSGCSKTMG